MSSRSKLLTHNLNQTAVYWGSPTSDGAGGRSFGSAYPEEIDVRWEQRHELLLEASGREVRSNAVVFVGQDVGLAGYLYMGTLEDLSSAEEADPLTIRGAYEIRGRGKLPDLKASRFARKAWL